MSANDPPSRRIIIEQDGDGWVIGDDERDFTRCTTITDALRYVSDLMYGPDNGPRGSVWVAMRVMEEASSVPEAESSSVSVGSPFGI